LLGPAERGVWIMPSVGKCEASAYAAPMDPWRLPATELSTLISRKEISPVEILETFLRRCERLNPRLNAIVAFDPEGARRAAQAAEARMRDGARRGPLDGLPVTIKDNILVAGFPAT